MNKSPEFRMPLGMLLNVPSVPPTLGALRRVHSEELRSINSSRGLGIELIDRTFAPVPQRVVEAARIQQHSQYQRDDLWLFIDQGRDGVGDYRNSILELSCNQIPFLSRLNQITGVVAENRLRRAINLADLNYWLLTHPDYIRFNQVAEVIDQMWDLRLRIALRMIS